MQQEGQQEGVHEVHGDYLHQLVHVGQVDWITYVGHVVPNGIPVTHVQTERYTRKGLKDLGAEEFGEPVAGRGERLVEKPKDGQTKQDACNDQRYCLAKIVALGDTLHALGIVVRVDRHQQHNHAGQPRERSAPAYRQWSHFAVE